MRRAQNVHVRRTPVQQLQKKNSKAMSNNNNNNNNSSNRNGYGFPDFSLRRLLLQTRGGRSSYTGRMCDLERGTGSNSAGGSGGSSSTTTKPEKNCHGSASSSGAAGNKVSAVCVFGVHFNRMSEIACGICFQSIHDNSEIQTTFNRKKTSIAEPRTT